MLFGDKQTSVFDLWTVQHIAVGMIVGYIVKKYIHSKIYFVISILIIAYSWEFLEYFAEVGFFGTNVALWFGGVELQFNRIVIDPLTFLLGALSVYKGMSPKILYTTVTLSLIWFVLNLMMPSVTYIQNSFF